MASDPDQTPRKLIYLRDHAGRGRTRRKRRRRDPEVGAPNDLDSEGVWLGRGLLALVAGLVLHWVGLTAAAPGGVPGEVSAAPMFPDLSHLVCAALALYGARSIRGGYESAPIVVAIAAGAILLVALQGLGSSLIGEPLDHLTPGTRADVLLYAVLLGFGLWSWSWALRSRSLRESVAD